MREGYAARAVIPGGGSTEFVLPELFDTPMDFDSMEKKAKSRLGTGTMIVLDDKTCPVGMLHSLEKLLRQGIVRVVHALPGRAALARAHPRVHRGRAGAAGRLDILREHTWLLKMRHTLLRPGTWGYGAAPEWARHSSQRTSAAMWKSTDALIMPGVIDARGRERPLQGRRTDRHSGKSRMAVIYIDKKAYEVKGARTS